jgi:hypothetical protein
MTQWPLLAIAVDDVPKDASVSFTGIKVSRFLAKAAILCHFFAI